MTDNFEESRRVLCIQVFCSRPRRKIENRVTQTSSDETLILPSSRVSIPLIRIGKLVMDFSHAISCGVTKQWLNIGIFVMVYVMYEWCLARVIINKAAK